MTVVERVVRRAQRVPAIAADAAIGAWIFAIGSFELVLGWNYPPAYPPAAVGLLVLAALGVTLRRRGPWAAFALVLASSIGGLGTNASFFGSLLALLVVLYTVSARSGVVASLLALFASLGAHYLALVRTGNGPRDIPALFLVNFAWIALAWFAGRAQARCRVIASDLGRTIHELDEERDRLARSSITLERGRIARELHAMVVRGVERMSVNTHAARRYLLSEAPQASPTIAEIESTGRRTLIEMRRLMHVLRPQEEGARSADGPSTTDSTEWSSPSDDGLSAYTVPGSNQRFSAARLSQRARRWVAVPLVADGLIVLAMVILAVAEPYVWPFALSARTYVPTAIVVVGALFFRRRAPLVVLVVIAAVILGENAFLKDHPFVADRSIMVAVFTVAAVGGARRGTLALGIGVIAYSPYLLWNLPNGSVLVLGWSSQMTFAVFAGLAVRENRALNAELREQSDTLRRTRQERIRRAVDEERLRIARDVHDLVAHGVTLMVIQAGAARWLAEDDPARAEKALVSVERAGREALRELQALVGSLGTSALDGAEPLPVDERLTIASLVDHAIGSGINVELVIRGDPRELDAGLGMSLFRIVQEALTNVGKHAPGARASVELRYTPEGVEVEVTDTGGRAPTGSPQPIPGSGQGLVGIAERVALFGGEAEAGPTLDGGFRVRASLAGERVPV